MTTTEERMKPVYGPCIDIIKNISPYQRHLERATSSKIMRIFEKLATPGFLLKSDGTSIVLKGLLQAFHAILENNFEGRSYCAGENLARVWGCPSLWEAGRNVEVDRIGLEFFDTLLQLIRQLDNDFVSCV